MITKPENVLFESTTDVVDYVSKGMIPTRKNFEKVMLKVKCPDEAKEEGQVYVPKNLFIECDNATMNEALHRVYENRIS